jgi:hypothetical protein
MRDVGEARRERDFADAPVRVSRVNEFFAAALETTVPNELHQRHGLMSEDSVQA